MIHRIRETQFEGKPLIWLEVEPDTWMPTSAENAKQLRDNPEAVTEFARKCLPRRIEKGVALSLTWATRAFSIGAIPNGREFKDGGQVETDITEAEIKQAHKLTA